MALAHILHSCFSGRLQAVGRHRPEEQPHTHRNPARCLLQPTQGRCSANGSSGFYDFIFFHDRASPETCGLHVQGDGWRWDDLIRSRAPLDTRAPLSFPARLASHGGAKDMKFLLKEIFFFSSKVWLKRKPRALSELLVS